MTSVLTNLWKTRRLNLSGQLFVAVAVLLGWEIAAWLLPVRAADLPPPSRIILELWQSWSLLQPAASVTCFGMAAGLGLAAAAGMALGLAMVSREGRPAFPEILKVPLLALAPLLIAWFGWDLAPRVILAFIVALLPVAAGTIEGLRSLPEPLHRILRCASQRGVPARLGIELRIASPRFFRALHQAAGFSFAAVVAGEFAGANRGLGHVALDASSKHNVPLLLASLAVMGVLLLLLQGLCSAAAGLILRGGTAAYPIGASNRDSGPAVEPEALPVQEGEFFTLVASTRFSELDSSTAYVGAEPALLGWRTVIENILLPARLRGLDPKDRYDRARWLMESLGLSGLEHVIADTLSMEQAQRVCICRELVLSPPRLLMEDPFRVLDSAARERLATDLEFLWSDSRFTVLLLTGQIDEAVRLSDRVAVMSPLPGEAPEIIEVSIPRPRRMDSSTTPAIMECCARIRILLRARGLLH